VLKGLREFLESEGGEKAVVIAMLVWIMAITLFMHMTGHDPKQTGILLLSNSFTALFAIFLKSLKRIN
jgi:hypothetical protein